MWNNYKVSVIVSTYNRSKLLELSLLSLCNQSTNKDLYEVIVVSDAIKKNIECHSHTSVEKASIGYLYGFDEYNENEKYLLNLQNTLIN